MFWGISVVSPGVKLNKVGKAIQKCADGYGYSLVRDYTGHGIGLKFHEGPRVLHYDSEEVDYVLEEGGTKEEQKRRVK